MSIDQLMQIRLPIPGRVAVPSGVPPRANGEMTQMKITRIVALALAMLAIALPITLNAQYTYTINPTPCYSGRIECLLPIQANLVDNVGTLLIVFPANGETPGHQGSFQVYEWYGADQLQSIVYTPTVEWGYSNKKWTATFTSPLGRIVLLEWTHVVTLRYGPAWIVMPSSRVVGKSMQ